MVILVVFCFVFCRFFVVIFFFDFFCGGKGGGGGRAFILVQPLGFLKGLITQAPCRKHLDGLHHAHRLNPGISRGGIMNDVKNPVSISRALGSTTISTDVEWQ